METYEFRYLTNKIKFSFEGGIINFKIGLRKGQIETAKILYFRKFEYKDYDHLIIIYKNNEGKKKSFKAFADKNSQGLNSLIFRMAELLPDKDLSNTSANEARKLMKVGNAAKSGAIGAAVIMFGILAYIFRGVFKDIKGNMPMIIIVGIVLLIVIGAFVFVYLKGKNESKDWE